MTQINIDSSHNLGKINLKSLELHAKVVTLKEKKETITTKIKIVFTLLSRGERDAAVRLLIRKSCGASGVLATLHFLPKWVFAS